MHGLSRSGVCRHVSRAGNPNFLLLGQEGGGGLLWARIHVRQVLPASQDLKIREGKPKGDGDVAW